MADRGVDKSRIAFQYPLLDRSVIRSPARKPTPVLRWVSVSTTGSFGNPACRSGSFQNPETVSVSTTGSFGNPVCAVGHAPFVGVLFQYPLLDRSVIRRSVVIDGEVKDPRFSIHYWIVR